MTSEAPLISDILAHFGDNWVVEENTFGGQEFRYLLKDIPHVSRRKFEQQFAGYTFDLYRVGGVGWVIKVHIYRRRDFV